MSTLTLKIDIPDSILSALNDTEKEFTDKMKYYTAIELYKEHKLSLGKSAELAGISKVEFLFSLSKYGIPVINYSKEELEEELRVLSNL